MASHITITTPVLTILLIIVLVLASSIDISSYRIPNVLTFGAFSTGLIAQVLLFGVEGLIHGLGGAGIGLLLFLPMYMLGGMAAGDVKLMAAAGAFMGPVLTLSAACLSLIAGGILGILVLLLRGGANQALHRYIRTLQILLRTGQTNWIPPTPGEAAGTRFPYALAIAAGTVTTLWWAA